MMKKLTICLYAFFAIFAVSCNDPMQENSGSENVSFNADLYFEKYGFQTVKMTTLNDDFTYNINVRYKNSGPITASLKVDETVLSNYNSFYKSTYKVLPANYYTLNETLDIKGENTSTAVVFNIKKIVAEIGLAESLNYVIPIKLNSSNSEIKMNDIGNEVLLRIYITKPTLVFDQKLLKISVDDTVAKPKLSVSAKYDFNNFDVSKLAVLANSDKVTAYNSTNGTNYLKLPANSFKLLDITVDTSKKQLTVNYSIDLNLVNNTTGTYLLPVDFSSDTYAFDPDSTIYFELKIKASKPVFEGVFNLTSNQSPTSGYESFPVNFDLAAAASLLKTTVTELKSNILFYGIKKDGFSFIKSYTANTGFWFNKNENPDSYNNTTSLLYVEYAPDGKFNVGQFPNAVKTGENHTVSMALVYKGLFVKYNITLKVQ